MSLSGPAFTSKPAVPTKRYFTEGFDDSTELAECPELSRTVNEGNEGMSVPEGLGGSSQAIHCLECVRKGNPSRRDRMTVARQFIAWDMPKEATRPVGTV